MGATAPTCGRAEGRGGAEAPASAVGDFSGRLDIAELFLANVFFRMYFPIKAILIFSLIKTVKKEGPTHKDSPL